jgi:DGQHR domain-containing protein
LKTAKSKPAPKAKLPKDIDPSVPFSQKRFAVRPVQVECQHAKQFDTDIYLGFAPLSALVSAGYVEVIDPMSPNQNSWGREASRRRIAKIASEFDARRPLMVDAIWANARKKGITVKPSDDGLRATIEFTANPENRILMIADGQHRLGGMSFSETLSDDTPVPVAFTIGLDTLRIRRLVSDIGGNVVRHNKSQLGYLVATFRSAEEAGKADGPLYDTNNKRELGFVISSSIASRLASMTMSPLRGKLVYHNREMNGSVPVQRIADMVNYAIARLPDECGWNFQTLAKNGNNELEITHCVIDFFRAIDDLANEDFRSGVILSARCMKVLARILWHVLCDITLDADGNPLYTKQNGEFSDFSTRYHALKDMLAPLETWQVADDNGSIWKKCSTDRTPIDLWYAKAVKLLKLEGTTCVPISGLLENS